MLVEVVLASSVPHRLLRHFKLWQQQYVEFRSLIQVFNGRRQRLRGILAVRGWLKLARCRVELRRTSLAFSLRRAWVWWCSVCLIEDYVCDLFGDSPGIRGPPPAVDVRTDSFHELMTYDLSLVGRHREWQEIREFQRSCSSRGGAIACAVCCQDGLKKCSVCKAIWYCSRECQSAHWSEHKGACLKPNSHLVHLLDMCSSDDLQRLDLTLKVCDEDY